MKRTKIVIAGAAALAIIGLLVWRRSSGSDT
jgi:hypothetical protein